MMIRITKMMTSGMMEAMDQDRDQNKKEHGG
jgi:hypothetical protein